MASSSSIILGFSLSLAAFSLAGCAAHASLPSYSAVPDFTLTDQNGAKFDSASKLKGMVWIADFIYTTCPGPCPRMSSQMHEVQTALSALDGFRLVSFTVDPEHDTPPVLNDYSKLFQARPGIWFFLTGPQSDFAAPQPRRFHARRRQCHSGTFDALRLD